MCISIFTKRKIKTFLVIVTYIPNTIEDQGAQSWQNEGNEEQNGLSEKRTEERKDAQEVELHSKRNLKNLSPAVKRCSVFNYLEGTQSLPRLRKQRNAHAVLLPTAQV